MLNVLYLGPYKQYDGIGHACKRYIDAISADLNIHLCIRPLFFSANLDLHKDEVSNYIEFENNYCDKYDILIQHGIPEFFEYNSHFGKNIGIVEIETTNLKHSTWVDKINLMDEIWVGSLASKDTLKAAGVTTVIKIVPQPYNLQKYNKTNYDDFFYFQKPEDRPYIFYTIGQYEEKNNIEAIIKAYLMEFSNIDNTKLFIKTGSHDMQDTDLEQLLQYDMSKIYGALRVDRTTINEPHIVLGDLSQTDLDRIHASSDCYVSASRGDCFGPNMIEGALFGNITIVTESTGVNTYINRYNGFVTKSHQTSVFTDKFISKQTRTIHEDWYDVDIDSLRKNMRLAYQTDSKEKSVMLNKFDRSVFDHKDFSKYLTL